MHSISINNYPTLWSMVLMWIKSSIDVLKCNLALHCCHFLFFFALFLTLVCFVLVGWGGEYMYVLCSWWVVHISVVCFLPVIRCMRYHSCDEAACSCNFCPWGPHPSCSFNTVRAHRRPSLWVSLVHIRMPASSIRRFSRSSWCSTTLTRSWILVRLFRNRTPVCSISR